MTDLERARKLADAARDVAPNDPDSAIEYLADAFHYTLLALEQAQEGLTA
jgi:hypothetical protein